MDAICYFVVFRHNLSFVLLPLFIILFRLTLLPFSFVLFSTNHFTVDCFFVTIPCKCNSSLEACLTGKALQFLNCSILRIDKALCLYYILVGFMVEEPRIVDENS